MGHVASIMSILFCPVRTTVKDSTHEEGGVPIKLYFFKKLDRFQPDCHCRQPPELGTPGISPPSSECLRLDHPSAAFYLATWKILWLEIKSL